VTPYGSYKNRRFGGTYRRNHQSGDFIRGVLQLLVSAYVPSSLIIFTLMMEAILFS
jgi:hypothetical protein